VPLTFRLVALLGFVVLQSGTLYCVVETLLVTVNDAASVPVCVSALVTITSRAVSAAVPEIVILAVIVVEVWTEYELTVMPVPENDRVPVLKFVPETVTLPV
jgi:hypothetical protein